MAIENRKDSPNHRDYIADVSPEMAREYDKPAMRGVFGDRDKARNIKSGGSGKIKDGA